jgi:hypothetical protein
VVKDKQTPGMATAPDPESTDITVVLAAGMGARIGQAADAIGTREVAARAIGVSPAALQRYVREVNNPPFDALARLCLRSGYRMEWLATGMGLPRTASGPLPPEYPESAVARWRVAEASSTLPQAAAAASAAIARASGAPPQADRFAQALALVDEAVGPCDPGATAPLAYLIEAVYELLGGGVGVSPAQVLRVIRNALALRV